MFFTLLMQGFASSLFDILPTCVTFHLFTTAQVACAYGYKIFRSPHRGNTMNIQAQLNKEAIDMLPRTRTAIDLTWAQDHDFERGQMSFAAIQSILALTPCLDDMAEDEIEKTDSRMVESFKESGWLKNTDINPTIFAIYYMSDNGFVYEASHKSAAAVRGGLRELSAGKYTKDNEYLRRNVALIKIDANYDKDYYDTDNGGGVVQIEVMVDGILHSDTFCVQLTGGEHLTSMGCLVISEKNGDVVFSEYSNGVFGPFESEIINAAETAYKAAKNNRLLNDGKDWEHHSSFNQQQVCATASCQVVVEKTVDGSFRAYLDTSGFVGSHEYATLPEFFLEYFDCEEKLENWKVEYEQ